MGNPEPVPNPEVWQIEHGWVVGRWLVGIAAAAFKKEVVDLWQFSQGELVTTWEDDLVSGVIPTANVWPVWQFMQPLTIPKWFIPAPVNDTVEEWQVSHDKLVGTCPDNGLEMGVTPKKLWPLWQLVQPPTIPVCFITVPLNPPVLVLLVEWQVSHDMLVGTWFTGLDFGVTPVNAWPLWQLVQPLTIPVCVIFPGRKLAPEPWQVEHGCAVGKWPTGGVVKLATAKVIVEVWQLEQSSEVVMCVGDASSLLLGVTPAKAWPLWQVVQPLTIPTWFIIAMDVGNKNDVKLVGEWQVSHGILVGMWLVGLDFGVTPVKLWPLWQLVHPLMMPLWLIVPGTRLACLWQVEQGCVVGRWFAGMPPAASCFQSTVLWQVSHESVVAMCPLGLPVAAVPLWQFWQVPSGNPTCLKVAGIQVVFWWQLSHWATVVMCLVVFACAPIWLPATWQLEQSRGVPLKTPLTWQDAQRAWTWEPLRIKPVLLWSNLRLPESEISANANFIINNRDIVNNNPTRIIHDERKKSDACIAIGIVIDNGVWFFIFPSSNLQPYPLPHIAITMQLLWDWYSGWWAIYQNPGTTKNPLDHFLTFGVKGMDLRTDGWKMEVNGKRRPWINFEYGHFRLYPTKI
jgi:hypothetical protein